MGFLNKKSKKEEVKVEEKKEAVVKKEETAKKVNEEKVTSKKESKKVENKKEEPKKVEEKAVEKVEEKKKAPAKKNYHISKRAEDGKWQVKFANGQKAIKLFDTQAEAITYAKSLAESQDGLVTIHKVDGKIRKQDYSKK